MTKEKAKLELIKAEKELKYWVAMMETLPDNPKINVELMENTVSYYQEAFEKVIRLKKECGYGQ